jgi:hypothetical protein
MLTVVSGISRLCLYLAEFLGWQYNPGTDILVGLFAQGYARSLQLWAKVLDVRSALVGWIIRSSLLLSGRDLLCLNGAKTGLVPCQRS